MIVSAKDIDALNITLFNSCINFTTGVSKNFFQPFGPQFGLKIRFPPLDSPLHIQTWSCPWNSILSRGYLPQISITYCDIYFFKETSLTYNCSTKNLLNTTKHNCLLCTQSMQCISYRSVLKTQLEMFSKCAQFKKNTQTQNIFKTPIVLFLKMVLNFVCLNFTQSFVRATY